MNVVEMEYQQRIYASKMQLNRWKLFNGNTIFPSIKHIFREIDIHASQKGSHLHIHKRERKRMERMNRDFIV